MRHDQRSRECDASRYRHGCDPPEPSDTAPDCNTASSPRFPRASVHSQPPHRTTGDTRCRLSLNTCRTRLGKLTTPGNTLTRLMPAAQTLLRRRLVILTWLIAWLSTVPLFHIHIPDTTDRWSRLQSGGAHTVFTPDLPGEFSHPVHDPFGHLSQRGVNSPELRIAVFNER